MKKVLAALFFLATGNLFAAEYSLENPQPNSIESGISAISGWACDALWVQIELNRNGNLFDAAYGMSRPDTQGACGDTDNGFAFLFNYGNLESGEHSVTLFIDGQERTTHRVTVTSLGEPFVTDVTGEIWLQDFPNSGDRTKLAWVESKQNFVIADSTVNQIYSWYIGGWNACSGPCGTDNATQIRTVYCHNSKGQIVSDTHCDGTKPDSNRACTSIQCEAETYAWYKSEWSACGGPCGTDNAIRDRFVACRNSKGRFVSDANCSGTKPANTESCTANQCGVPVEYSWHRAAWGVCTGPCGDYNGIQSRAVYCLSSTDQPADELNCGGLKPSVTQICTASQCQ